MIYIIYGIENILIQEDINKIIEQYKDYNLMKFDASSKDFDIDSLLFECQNIDMFGNSSLIMINDPWFLVKKKEDKKLDNFINYCEHQNNDNVLVFYTYNNNFNDKLSVFKAIKKNAKIKHYEKLKGKLFYDYASNIIKESGLVLDRQSFNMLLFGSNSLLSDLKKNIDVLKIYPGKITNDVVKNLLSVPTTYENFDLINAICEKDLTTSKKLVNEMIGDKDSVVPLISQLSNQLRFLYVVSLYLDEGKSKKEIVAIYACKEYRITKAIETLNKLSKKDILKLLSLIADLDLKVKTTGYLSQRNLLELFILEISNAK